MKPGHIIPASFYARDTELVARDMLGMLLQCTTAEGATSGIIVETEAYIGEHDAACHAAAGLTTRTAPLYDRAGIAYVYFIYGMYWCFNAVTRAKGLPSAVLVRAVEPVEGIARMRRRRPRAHRDRDLTNGPGKLCLALGITGSLNKQPLQRGSLVIRDYTSYPDASIAITPRIGIRHAADWPLRWIVAGNEYVSKG
ncbi:MAG TPA: DNA-3-methyladenine glycosylase [Gemmatimonadaceae bacterium]